MKRLLLCLILSSCATLSAQVDAALAAQFQEVLDNRVSDYGDHGVSACVVLPGGEVWTGQSGYAGDLEEIEENTVFHAASITKMHVAVVMLQLAEEGMVNLDAPF
ncbi:MAG: serine hydrolase, partial [Flavobacteriales bacterium]|nr:serine hydrolase [Flavobacteriales bacterium]